jgi:deoxyribose-phosphate aldolase
MTIFHKLELDVMQTNELEDAAKITTKYKLPAMVVHPFIASEALFMRGRMQGRYKIYTPVDWPKGDNFAMLKLRGLSSDALDVDGFEILLTGNKMLGDTKNEAKTLTNFIKQQLSQVAEVRFVLGTIQRIPENIALICEALLSVPMPAMVRNDHHLKLQVGRANTDVHNTFIEDVLKVIRVPIKLSGNINTVRSVTACEKAQRFAVNVSQARAIIKEIHQQPEQLKSILDA